MRNANAPAYPRPFSWDPNPVDGVHMGDRPEPHVASDGMTKREAFAMAAMQGTLASVAPSSEWSSTEIAHWSVRCADALLAELAK